MAVEVSSLTVATPMDRGVIPTTVPIITEAVVLLLVPTGLVLAGTTVTLDASVTETSFEKLSQYI